MSGTQLFKLFGTIGLNGVDGVNKDLNEVSGNAEKSSNKMVSAFKTIGTAIATYVTVDAIVNFGKSCVDAAANVGAEAAAFGQIMGGYADMAQKKLSAVADETGIVDTRLTGHMTSLTAKFKGLGFDVTEATTLASDGLKLAADGAAFWDMSLDESVSHLNSFINGSYEGGEAIGLFANDTQMAAYAVEQGLIKDTKAWASLDEATKQATRLEYAENMYALSGATGQAAKESDSYLNVQGNLSEAWRQFQATIGEPIMNEVVIPAMKKLTELLPAISEKIGPIADKIINLGSDIGEFWNEWILPAIENFGDDLSVAKDNLQPVIDLFKGFVNDLTGGADGFDLLRVACKGFETGMAVLGSFVASVAAEITNFVTWLNNGSAGAETLKAVIVAVTAAFVVWKTSMAIQSLVSNVVSGVKSMITTFKTLWATMIANPVTLIIAAIVALVAGFVYLWNNCEGFRNFWIGLWNKIKQTFSTFVNWCKNTLNSMKTFFSNAWTSIKNTASNIWNGLKNSVVNIFNSIKTTASRIWNNIKDAIMNPIEKARDKVKEVIDKIKGFFSGWKFSWPKIPMPKFGISPSGWKIGDLLKGSIPKLSIKWNAQGAILDKPTIFGVSGNTLLGGGEAGKEAVAPINTLQEYVRSAVRSELGLMESYMVRVVETLDEYLPKLGNERNIVLDTGALVGAMGSSIDATMGNINRRKERWG